MNLLSTTDVAHSFEYELFSDVTLALDAQESIAIIGMSGSGKSTLLHILSTLLTQERGSVSLFGEDIASMSKKRLTEIKRKDLGIIFQSHYLFNGFSAYENLEVAEILSQNAIDDTLLERLNIEDVIQNRVTKLSGGQQQRVSIARVLTKQPRIIFADEPTGNLDKKTADEVMQLFFEYCREKNAGMILVTHDETLAHQCQKVYKLEDKKLQQVQ